MIQKLLTQVGIKILMFLGQSFIDWLEAKIKEAKRAKAQEEAKKKYEEVKKNPQSTHEEVGKAYEDLINAGRNS